MFAYVIRRLLLILPTLLGIMAVNFVIINMAPGGPIQQMIANLQQAESDVQQRLGSGEGSEVGGGQTEGQTIDTSRAGRGIDPALLERLQSQLGFDRPWYERFGMMIANYVTFDFGESFFKQRPVVALIVDRLPVSISLGVWTTILIYLICIPLGIRKAVRDGSRFDMWTSTIVIVGNAIPSFMFAILLIILFAGGRFLDIFPLQGLVSENWGEMPWYQQILDYFWHLILPVTAMVISGFATLTLLTKNSFLEEINKQYVVTARAKGVAERRVLYGHVFRNAMLIVIAGFPAAFVSILFTSNVLIEVIFNLNGLGLLGFEAVLDRDYPVMFATLYMFSLLALVIRLITDITYVLIDPRIDFEAREV